MIAMRRLVVRGWGVEAGMRVQVIHPAKASDQLEQANAHRAASVAEMLKRVDRVRNDTELLWRLHGGR
ncbi:MAG TPA: hypothetical protein VD789_01860 [Thermomicrobiales bacterium]|nr:hypothetical protein [Thermomicrobiales bacterium]